MAPAKWLILCSLLVETLWARDISLVRVGDVWRYFKGLTEPSSNVLEWTKLEYDDAHWLSGPGGFGTSAITGEPTSLLDYGDGYHTVYLRNAFKILDTNNIADLILRIDYDDAFVAYLNGVEVARRGAPGLAGAPVPVEATAPYHPRGFTEEIGLADRTGLLQQGTNLLAVQVLGSGPADASIILTAELLANVTRGPFLQSSTPESTLVVWKTFRPADGRIEYGTNILSAQRLEVSTRQTNHVADLRGLEPDTDYLYRIISAFDGKETHSDWIPFHTLKRSGPVTFHIIGDSGWASPAQFALAHQMDQSPADLLIHVGDIIYGSFSHYNSDLKCFSTYADQMRSRPWYIVLGNHEMYYDKQAALQSFYLPTNQVTGTEHFYSFDHGDVHFAVTWSDVSSYGGAEYQPGSPQYEWLDEDLGKTTKPWKFLFFHHVWRSSSAHRVDDYDNNLVLDMRQLDESFAQLARKHGVQVVFNGHDHGYERFAPSGGPISFISGGGGALLYGFGEAHPDNAQYHNRHHYLRVTVNGEEAKFEAVGTDGGVFDQVHLRRTFPERTVYSSTWNTPVIENGPANDGDGNTIAQIFDFQGNALHGPFGLFTSTGRLFVNNDQENLYLGLDEVMLRAREELFLFIETPGFSGVASMENVGNGIVDPAGQGADGLDFAANLVFTNFNPAIGVILGDEHADGPSRSFVRTGASVSTGQGAFYLTNSLPEVPGQRLVQFNVSPQFSSAYFENNANFIELALPYSALGELKPGQTIRVGAVTARAIIDTNAPAWTRPWDTGGIGYSSTRRGDTTVLEGVQVRLALDPNGDSDADGLPDEWETRFGLDPLNASGSDGSQGDPDADGASNLHEFRAGTSPANADSRFDLQVLQASARELVLRWSTVPGENYQVEYRDTFSDDFQIVDPAVFPRRAAGSSDSITLDFSAGQPPRTRYYRVQLVE